MTPISVARWLRVWPPSPLHDHFEYTCQSNSANVRKTALPFPIIPRSHSRGPWVLGLVFNPYGIRTMAYQRIRRLVSRRRFYYTGSRWNSCVGKCTIGLPAWNICVFCMYCICHVVLGANRLIQGSWLTTMCAIFSWFNIVYTLTLKFLVIKQEVSMFFEGTRRLRMGIFWLCIVLFAAFAVVVDATELTFELPDNAKQCFYEEVEKGVKCTLEFQVNCYPYSKTNRMKRKEAYEYYLLVKICNVSKNNVAQR